MTELPRSTPESASSAGPALAGGTSDPSPTGGEPDATEHPRGTLFLMMLFLIMIAALWTYVFVLMLERS